MIIQILKRLRIKVLITLFYPFVHYEKGFSFGRGTTFYARDRLIIGKNVYIGKYCSIETNASIGDNVLIGNHVGFVGRNDHDIYKIGIPMKSAPQVRDQIDCRTIKDKKIIVDDDVWIGFGAVVLSGVRIGRGSIVAAGAVVTKDVEPYSIVAGNPAKKIKMRFQDKEITEHEIAQRRKSNCIPIYSKN